jgi:hypothetical protein
MNVRGSVMMPSRPNDLDVSGPVPGLIVYPKRYNARVLAEFFRFCRLNALDAKPVDDEHGACEVVGGVADLQRLIAHSSVSHWHYVMSVKPPSFRRGEADRLMPLSPEMAQAARRTITAGRKGFGVEVGFKERARVRYGDDDGAWRE